MKEYLYYIIPTVELLFRKDIKTDEFNVYSYIEKKWRTLQKQELELLKAIQPISYLDLKEIIKQTHKEIDELQIINTLIK